ncbi:MAG: hypothetical protein R3F20_11885 [Planctomycetota bacterium]
MIRSLVLLSVLLSLTAGPTVAQELPNLYEIVIPPLIPGPEAGDLDRLDDLDGDGVPELLVGVRSSSLGVSLANGFALVISGATGATLQTLMPPPAVTSFGLSVVAIDDVDGDGLSDLGVSSHEFEPGFIIPAPTVRVHVYSSASGALLMTLAGPTSSEFLPPTLTMVGDLDGDGHRDLAMASASFFNIQRPALVVRSPVDGSLLAEVFYPGVVTGGAGVAAMEDVNGDGTDDLAFGFSGPFLPPGPGSLALRSGTDLSSLTTFTAAAAGSQFGSRVWSLGDIDLDGRTEILTPRGFANGSLVFDALSSSAEYEFSSVQPDVDVHRAAGSLDDADGDGHPDWFVVDDLGGLRVFGGFGNREQDRWAERLALNAPVRGAAPLADLDGDGASEFAVAVGNTVRVVSLAGRRAYGPGGDLTLDWHSFGIAGSLAGEIEVTGGAPGAPGILLASFATASFPFAGLPVVVDPTPAAGAVTASFTFGANGAFCYGVSLGQNALAGRSIFVQAFQSAFPFRASNGLELLFARTGHEVSSFSPTGVLGGETGIVTGFGFDAASTITIDDVPVTVTAQTSDELQFVVPAGVAYDAKLGVRSASGEVRFLRINPTPTMTLNTTAGPAAGGNVVVIQGGPFLPGTTMTIGNAIATPVGGNEGTRTFLAPPGTVGPAAVVVTIPSSVFAGGYVLTGTYFYE